MKLRLKVQYDIIKNDDNYNNLQNGYTTMNKLKFKKELYSKTALIKAAYNFTDKAYVHLDSDDKYYYVTLDMKESGKEEISEHEFENEMLAQSVRHEIYNQTKNIRELLLARAMATSVVMGQDALEEIPENDTFCEDEILKDWFADND